MRLIDRFVSEWAAPSLKAVGFRKSHRKFTLSGSVQIQLDFRLHPLGYAGETFWIEWWRWSEAGPTHLPERIETPPVMSLDPATRAVWPPEYFFTQVQLWRITEDTAQLYGPMLRDLLEQTFIPIWLRLREQESTHLTPEDRASVGRVSGLMHAVFNVLGERVAGGDTDRLEPELTRIEQDYPDNVWVQWWRSVQKS